MLSKYERGALHLIGVAVVSGLVACVAMASLYSMRTERNLFAEGWTKLSGAFRQTQHAAEAVTGTGASSTIYQCNMNGKVLYSNVACDAKSTASKKVDIQDTRGFEAPKVAVEAPSTENDPMALKEKMIENALSRR
jgi:hypothetical protein